MVFGVTQSEIIKINLTQMITQAMHVLFVSTNNYSFTIFISSVTNVTMSTKMIFKLVRQFEESCR